MILPAGGRISGSFASEAAVEVKALIEIGGRTVIERSLEVLSATGCVGRIVVVGPEEIASHPISSRVDIVLPDGGSAPENILRGLQWLREADGGLQADRVVAMTTDLPFVTPEAISSFLDACPTDADVCMPVIERKEYEARFPDFQGEFVRLSDGEWTIGCIFSLNPVAIERNLVSIERVFRARKSQLGMARLLGLPFILRFLTRRLTIAQIEQRTCQILGCTGCGIRGAAPELAFDIDQIDGYRYAAAGA